MSKPKRYTFTTDWFSRNIPIWKARLPSLLPENSDILEIGCWEGMATIWMLDNLNPNSLYVIDTFEGSDDHKEHFKDSIKGLKERFVHNMILNDNGNKVVICNGTSELHLKMFGLKERKFDLIYIDGSHKVNDVRNDCFIAWQLVKPGGIMIMDDYFWGMGTLYYDERPQAAIDDFLSSNDDKEIILKGQQVWCRKV